MNSGLSPADPTIVAAFRSALIHQWAIIVGIFLLLLLLYGATRSWLPARSRPPAAAPESRARRLLRIGFGIIWVFDGILQAQPKMAAGMPSQVIQPAASSSPTWVQHLVNWGGTVWSYHPIEAGASAVWIQVGIGLWLIVAERGWWSRAAGLASVGWGLVVWVFGESFGGIFAPGLTWLFGAPGAVLIYVVAGALIALPERAWRAPLMGRLLLAGIGVFFIGMAVLQAWPGRGFWQGALSGQPGSLTTMVQTMAGTSQPHVLSAMISAFASFTAAHGWAVNLFAVIALAVLGAAFLSGRPRLVRAAVIAGAVFCLADWVLIEDFGFLGGLGTDPNSMIPWILLFTAGYLALTPAPEPAVAAAPATEPATGTEPEPATRIATEPATGTGPADGTPSPAPSPQPAPVPGGLRGLLRPAALRDSVAAASARSVVALGAVGVIAVGAAPMAAASANRNADPILAQALVGSTAPIDQPAPAFDLTSQDGRQVSLASLHGKVVLLTFLDPVCTTDCPIIAQEMKAAWTMLGPAGRHVELVAIVANPTYLSTAFTQAFSRQEGLSTVPNWLYLTGTLSQLRKAWGQYGIEVQNVPAGAMSAHSDDAFVIDASGHMRQEFSDDPGPGTSSTQSSFAVLLSGAAQQVLRSQ